MGSFNGSQIKKRRRNSDCVSNYVDRVRICDTKTDSTNDSPGKHSGWRQKSLSNIDLSSNSKGIYQPGAGAFRYKDFEANLYESYEKDPEIQQDYEDVYNINPKAQNLSSSDIIYEHADAHFYNNENEACSLRRTRSLAVIREETFNDLSITNPKTRRSQLIPRAKLVDRNFFKERYNFVLEDEKSIIESEHLENGSQYSGPKRYSSNSHHFPWQCDRSDLDSIDSSIFKNSLHQSGLERSNTFKSDSTKITSKAEIHSDLNGEKFKTTINTSEPKTVSNATTLEQFTPLHRSGSNYSIKEEAESGITIIEIKDKKHSKENSSVISYDSIYLSSESDKVTVLEDPLANKNNQGSIQDFEDILKDLDIDSEIEKTESTIDTLYSQVTKSKPKIVAVEPKINTNTYKKHNDFNDKNTIEKISIHAQQSNSKLAEKENITKKAKESETFVNANTESQYSSLPDADISKILRDSELIDAELRLSVEKSREKPSIEEPDPDYDSIDVNQFQDNDSEDSVSLEELPKGAPSIEVVPLPIKEPERQKENKKVYLHDIGLELDYENSIASGDSDSDRETPAVVSIGGRKVIVDEVAAKAVLKDKEKKIQSNKENKENITTFEEFENQEKQAKLIPELKVILADAKEDNEKSDIPEKSNHTKEHKKEHYFRARPIKIKFDSPKGKKVFKALEIITQDPKTKMPRPQLLQIVDSKRTVCQVFPRQNNSLNKEKTSDTTNDVKENEAHDEFQHKVDAVRNYWSKIIDGEETDKNTECSNKSFDQTSQTTYFTANASYQPSLISENDNEFQSFIPTVEIVELDGQKQAALVKTKSVDDIDFDHVRYKVMKSDMFQKNLYVNNHRKEAQFDGLIQYLQDYSFQELLAHNNVVIIEPVRTKIEKTSDKQEKVHLNSCKITNGALQRNGSKNLKKNFYYQPIRVNKELHEDELPVPDTVRNVRKLFEGNVRYGNCNKSSDDSKIMSQSDNLRKKAIRYLTIDTSYGNHHGIRKWDSASLSSGVSSGDLSSPCECGESYTHDIDSKRIFSSEENLCDDDEFETHYVSQDVLEKIRECGSTVTYYGGQVVDKKTSPEEMTKMIMKEIKQQKCHCQPRKMSTSEENDQPRSRKNSSEYLGMKFKLVKSNSCSSRLELAGTGHDPKIDEEITNKMRNIIHRTPSPVIDVEEPEETVRDMVYKLENKKDNIPSKPRIIESKCIEKIYNEKNTENLKKNFQAQEKHEDDYVMINNQTIEFINQENKLENKTESELNKIVTVNNHISITPQTHKLENIHPSGISQSSAASAKAKVVRNKNVDLAFAAMANKNNLNNKPIKDKENLARKVSSSNSDPLSLKKTLSKDSLNDAGENKTNDSSKLTKWNSVGKLESSEMVNSQSENGIKHNQSNQIELPSAMKSPNSSGTKSTKMVNWCTVGKLNKDFAINDKRLIENRKYDEMDFEEFEVMGENHYDSLNSNK